MLPIGVGLANLSLALGQQELRRLTRRVEAAGSYLEPAGFTLTFGRPDLLLLLGQCVVLLLGVVTPIPDGRGCPPTSSRRGSTTASASRVQASVVFRSEIAWGIRISATLLTDLRGYSR